MYGREGGENKGFYSSFFRPLHFNFSTGGVVVNAEGRAALRAYPSSESSVRTRARIAEWGTMRYFLSSNSISMAESFRKIA